MGEPLPGRLTVSGRSRIDRPRPQAGAHRIAALAREARAHHDRLPGSSRALPLGARGFMLARVLSLLTYLGLAPLRWPRSLPRPTRRGGAPGSGVALPGGSPPALTRASEGHRRPARTRSAGASPPPKSDQLAPAPGRASPEPGAPAGPKWTLRSRPQAKAAGREPGRHRRRAARRVEIRRWLRGGGCGLPGRRTAPRAG